MARMPFWFLACLLACNACAGEGNPAARTSADSELPLASATCTISQDDNAQFLDSIRTFAEQDGYAIRIAKVTPDATGVLVQLYREDLKLIGVNPFDARKFDLYIYSNDGAAVTKGAAERALASLFSQVGGAACVAENGGRDSAAP